MFRMKTIAGWRRALMIGAAAATLLAPAASAQRGLRQGKHRQEPPPKPQKQKQQQQKQQQGQVNGASQPAGKAAPQAGTGVPPQWMERLQQMTPAEQERFLQNNQRFRDLPPGQQAQIRERLKAWQQLTPDERRTLRERAKVWENMPPEQRQRVRQQILPKWKQLTPDRRQDLRRRLASLNGLSEEERQAKLNDAKFMEGLNANEQGLLKDMSNLRVSPSPGAESPPN
jgi:hypothetical protein